MGNGENQEIKLSIGEELVPRNLHPRILFHLRRLYLSPQKGHGTVKA
jgi:hypothetical protein